MSTTGTIGPTDANPTFGNFRASSAVEGTLNPVG
jgi:hypothetical protein